MKYLILGNGAAGITAAEKLRELNSSDEITVVSKEDTPVYSKIMLPDYIGGKLKREKLFLREMKQYDKNRIRLLLGTIPERIDTVNKEVIFTDGTAESYDKLLIAIGGIPFVPSIEGLNEVEYLSVNSLRDAEVLKEKASAGGKALVVGAGLTGIEISFALKRMEMEVFLIERENKLLPQQLDGYSSDMLAEKIQAEGIELITGETISRVTQQKTACLSGGRQLAFDILVISIGTRPNIQLIENTGIEYNQGILVDEYMKTSVEDVYAAGDVAERRNKLSKGYVSSYIWPNAMAQGKCAAFNMSGHVQEFSGTSAMQNLVQLKEIPFVSAGLINPEEQEVEVLDYYDAQNGIYKKLVIKDNVLKGMILLGDTSDATVLGGYMRKETDLSHIKDTLLELGLRANAISK